MTDDKIPFLRARLDEDERIARACPGGGVWDANGFAFYGRELSPEVRAHAVEHDPARVLREVPVKRARLAFYEDALQRWTDLPREERATITGEALRTKVTTLEIVIQGDMQSYASHPGFKDHWRM